MDNQRNVFALQLLFEKRRGITRHKLSDGIALMDFSATMVIGGVVVATAAQRIWEAA